MRQPLHPDDLGGAEVVFLLDFEWGGHTFRVATQTVSMQDASGNVFQYDGGLADPDAIDERLGREEWDAPESTATIEFTLAGINVAQQDARGFDLFGARGTLWLITLKDGAANQTMEQRHHILTGQALEPEYGVPDQPDGYIRCTLREEPWDLGRPLIGPDEAITAETFAGAPDASIGKVYPTVIGAPGYYADESGTLTKQPGSPAYIIDLAGSSADELLIAGHPVAAPSVTIIDESGDEEVFNVTHKADGLGRIVATVDVSGAGTITRSDSTFWVSWHNGGGVIDPFGGGTLEAAPRVVAWALQVGGLMADVGRWLALDGFLPAIKVGTYSNDPESSVWDWLRAYVLPLLPAVVRRDQAGVFPVVYDSGMAHDREVFRLREGPGFTRQSGKRIIRQPGEVPSRILVEYAVNASTDEYKRRVDLRPDVDTADPQQGSSLHVLHASSQHGGGSLLLQLQGVSDQASAHAFAVTTARLRGNATRSATYLADRWAGFLRVGQRGRIDDDRIYWTDQRCIVSAKSYQDGGWLVELSVDPEPVRDARSV